jgi:hypothetical protein
VTQADGVHIWLQVAQPSHNTSSLDQLEPCIEIDIAGDYHYDVTIMSQQRWQYNSMISFWQQRQTPCQPNFGVLGLWKQVRGSGFTCHHDVTSLSGTMLAEKNLKWIIFGAQVPASGWPNFCLTMCQSPWHPSHSCHWTLFTIMMMPCWLSCQWSEPATIKVWVSLKLAASSRAAWDQCLIMICTSNWASASVRASLSEGQVQLGLGAS